MKRTRADRRHHAQRMSERAKAVLTKLHVPTDPKTIGRWRDNLRKCSCWMCQREPAPPREHATAYLVDEGR